ncbi:hypothetical protein [Mesorhizobium sp. Z1-4]|uniref:hypothetical protein n=1 Tax=Mesorhizobium sp. Z1-4 TaxID=2448478 RepID=UPI0013DFE28F|nr:hypothetical protein [Mesorhizobium sp. Z1-4]
MERFDPHPQRELASSTALPTEITEAIGAVEILTRFDVQPGTEVPQNILRASVVVFHPGATLQIGSPDDAFVALWAERLFIQDGSIESKILVPRYEVWSGKGGAFGQNGAAGTNKHPNGFDGADGAPGNNGNAGRELPAFVLLVDAIDYGKEPTPGKPPVSFHATGVDGGFAGAGGNGGAGGRGRDGYKGYSYDDDFPIP